MPGEKILLADDDPQMLGLLTEFLAGQGYQVTTAADGHQALAALEKGEFHLALLDLKLPGLSGLQVLFLIKAHSPETEVILFTGHAGLESAIEAMRLGAYDYLVKSGLRLADLQASVERALERHRLARANRELVDHLRQAQEELAQRRAAELVQIRRTGESLAGALTWEQILGGLLNLIWESLPLEVLALEVQGAGAGMPLEAYRRQPDLGETTFQHFKTWAKAQIHLEARRETDPGLADPPPRQIPCPALLWEKVRVGEVLALVAAGRQAPFSPEEGELFRIFTLQGQAALRNLLLFQQVQSLALRDGLTGLYNFRHFWEVLGHQVELSRRYGRPLAMLFLDLDDFKVINDTLGHPAGDLVLKTVAAYLEGAVRQADVVCRYGGEEFVVLLPYTSLEQGLLLAERLRLGVSQMAVPLPDGEIKCSVSIGVAGLDPGMDGEALVQAADAALYRAKETGKNRVCGAEGLGG
jgi:diguanylate cyclase (GGDEF)-like protein